MKYDTRSNVSWNRKKNKIQGLANSDEEEYKVWSGAFKGSVPTGPGPYMISVVYVCSNMTKIICIIDIYQWN